VTTQVVAIDGPAGSGKSTVARALATRLAWSYLDTGSMYRAIAAEVIARGVDPHDADAVAALAESATIVTEPTVAVNGRDVEAELRSPAVNRAVSIVAAVPRVRAALVAAQRRFATDQPAGSVIEGRDIATVVFPDALLKVYLTASVSERVARRGDESKASLMRRDAIDAGRDASPLHPAADARTIDTTDRSVEDVVKEILSCLATP
jgi:cytidylate kinase